jgi:putative flippase GtrA
MAILLFWRGGAVGLVCEHWPSRHWSSLAAYFSNTMAKQSAALNHLAQKKGCSVAKRLKQLWPKRGLWLAQQFARLDRPLRFVVVGSLNTAFGYSCYALFLSLEIHYAIAAALATIAGALFNFKTTSILVFRRKENRLLLRFLAVYVIIYVVYALLLRVLITNGLTPYAAGAILVLPSAIGSYFALSVVVYRKKAGYNA